jgi:hypothetical protein
MGGGSSQIENHKASCGTGARLEPGFVLTGIDLRISLLIA